MNSEFNYESLDTLLRLTDDSPAVRERRRRDRDLFFPKEPDKAQGMNTLNTDTRESQQPDLR